MSSDKIDIAEKTITWIAIRIEIAIEIESFARALACCGRIISSQCMNTRQFINEFDTDPDSDFDPDGFLIRQQISSPLMSRPFKKR